MEPLESYLVFAEVVERDSFTDAAEALGVSKSTASKHVARLEEALGARLLNRTTRQMNLTEAGRAVYARCQQIADQLEAIRADLEQLTDEPRGRLRVNAPMTFGLMHLSPLVGAFRRRYPEVELDLQLDDKVVDLVAGGFDVGVRIMRELTTFSMRARRLASSRRLVCATPAYLDAHGAPRVPSELAAHPCIKYSYLTSGDVWVFDGPRGQERVRVSGPIESNSSFVIREAVLADQGIAQFPAFAIADELAEGRLVCLLDDWTMPPLNVFALYPETSHVAPKVRAFIDFVAEGFAAARW